MLKIAFDEDNCTLLYFKFNSEEPKNLSKALLI